MHSTILNELTFFYQIVNFSFHLKKFSAPFPTDLSFCMDLMCEHKAFSSSLASSTSMSSGTSVSSVIDVTSGSGVGGACTGL